MEPAAEAALLRWGFREGERAAWSAYVSSLSGAPPGLPGRVASEHKGGLFVATAQGERLAVVPGRVRRAAEQGLTVLPTVGDWVALGEQQGTGAAHVVSVLPRRSVLRRRAAGEKEVAQTLAANVDAVLLVSSLGAEVNPRRLERALAVVRESGARPILVLSKADVAADRAAALAELSPLSQGAAALAVSARTGEGLPELAALLPPGETAVLLGPSGVGKSTLVNRWLGTDGQATSEIDAAGKGRHTTTHRELLVLPWGALMIDTPGLRELGLWESDEGVREAFDDIEALAQGCRFGDCAHQTEPGCAVHAAVASGALGEARWQHFLKLRSELAAAERRKDARAFAEGKLKDKEAARRMNELKRPRKR